MGVNNQKTTFVLSSKLYDFGKNLVLVFLPAISSAYFALAKIWGLPSAEEVVGSIAVVSVFLGSVLHISNSQYKSSDVPYDGTVTATPNAKGTRIKVNVDPSDLVNKKSVTLKVESPGPQ